MSEPVDSSTLTDEQQQQPKSNDEANLTQPQSLSSGSDQEKETTSSPESGRRRKQSTSSKCKLANQPHHPHLHHHHHHHSIQKSNQHSTEEDKMSKSPDQPETGVEQQQLKTRTEIEQHSKVLQKQLQLLVNTVDSNVGRLVDKDQQFSSAKSGTSGHINFGYQSSPITSVYSTAQANMNKSSTNATGGAGGGVTHTLTLSKSQNYPNHCHTNDSAHPGIDKLARKKLIIASLLCLLFMIGETVGGLLANSLAIATDAAHLLTDFASFMISLFSIWMASRPATKKMSFGYFRAEVIGALTSVLLIWVVTGILVLIAVQRLISGEYKIDAPIMLITAGIGVLVNIM